MKDTPKALRKRARFMTLWLRSILRSIAKFRISNVTTYNRELVPKKDAVIVVANHRSIFDPLYLWGSLRRPGTAITADMLWKNKALAAIFSILGMIKLTRGDKNSGAKATELMDKMLEHGGLGFLFPEGWVSRDGLLHKFFPGAARMSFEHNCPVILCALTGVEFVKPVGTWKIRLRMPVTVNYFARLDPKDFESPEHMTECMRRKIAEASGQELAPVK